MSDEDAPLVYWNNGAVIIAPPNTSAEDRLRLSRELALAVLAQLAAALEMKPAPKDPP
jgi:hypothetical protein